MVGPDYQEPKTKVMEKWLDNTSVRRESRCQNQLWWQNFHDPILTKLIDEGYPNNLSLQALGARVLQARATLAQSVGELYPQQQAVIGNILYNRIGGTSLQTILPQHFTTATLGLTASWELDFWGKYRRAILSNDALFLASIAAYDNALVSLTADIANTYIKFRTNQAQIITTKSNILVQNEGLRIARARYKSGQTSLVDVMQAQTELSQTEASLPPLMASQQSLRDAMAVLLGTTPDNVVNLLNVKKGIPRAPSQVGVSIPKEALARRPDIFQARLQAVAQSETIGAVKASLYPALSLTGTFVFASNTINGNSLSDIFNWSNRNILAGPNVNWPILNYGQITNAVRAQDAVFQQALLQYENLVLQAQKEIQDAITGFMEAKKTVVLMKKANQAATETLRLALIRYKEGETDFTPVLNAEQQQLQIQTSLNTAEGNVPTLLVSLYRALGGGWEIRANHGIVSEGMKQEMAARTNWGSLLREENLRAPLTKQEEVKALYLPKW